MDNAKLNFMATVCMVAIISQSINKSYLLLTDVSEFVDIDNHALNLQYSNSFSGALHMS